MDAPARRSRLAPLILATMASQSLLVVLAPTLVAIGSDLAASDGAVGQARSVTAVAAIAASVTITAQIGRLGVRRVLRLGAVLAMLASAWVAAAPTLPAFLAAHGAVGVAVACLLTAGFAGVSAFPAEHRGWALGYVAGANALAWIVVNPLVGMLTDWLSWRVAHAVPAVIALAALVASRNAAPVTGAASRLRLSAILADGSARRWLMAELAAFGAWAALLTFVGAYFIGRLGVSEGAAGWLLACGAAAYFAASTHSRRVLGDVARRRLVALSALTMAALMAVQFATRSVWMGLVVFCLIGLAAGIRTPASSGLGLEQLPGHPGAMMGARTAVTQLGYLFGAVIGGALITVAGYAAFGLVLAVGMATSAGLILRVEEGSHPRAPA